MKDIMIVDCVHTSSRRRLARLKSYDYSLNGAYYVTIVTKKHLCLFGDVTNDTMQLNDAGKMIASQWCALPTKFPNTQLDEFIVMPNHIHGIIIFVGASLVGARNNASNSGEKNDTPTRNLGDVIGAYKSLTTVAFTQGVKTLRWPPFPKKLWQRNYYEHIIRNDEDLFRIQQYINDNPARWSEDPDNLQKIT